MKHELYKNVKKFICWCGKAIVAGVFALAILTIFCMFYAYDGIHITSETGATDYVWESGQIKATMREGNSWLRMDSYGYNNIEDNSESPNILLMGSSNIEGTQVKQKENAGALLNEWLPEFTTYNIGMSGHTLYRCLDNLDNAIQTYEPQDVVVVVTDSIDMSVDQMQEVIDGKATPIPSYDSGIIYMLQKIPSIKAIYKQITDWLSLQIAAEVTSDSDSSEASEESYDEVLSEFLAQAAELTKKEDLTLMIVYQPSQQLQKDGTVIYLHEDEKVQKFMQECDKQDIVFIDLTENFDKLFEEEYILTHGFNNSAVGCGHLNKYGHKVAAEAIVSKIQELEIK